MTSLLELREKLKLIYSKNEVFIMPVVKFILAFIALNVVNGQLGYMNKINNIAIVLIVSLLCSFLPNGCIILFAAVFGLLHMYALSMEVALVGLCVYLVMFLLFFRFSPKDSIVVVITPILFVLKIPYVIPIAMGLLGTPAAAVSIGCGAIIYYFIENVSANATTINTMAAEEATAKLRLVIDGLLDNKAMVITIAAFAITVILVYFIRRMAIDYSWTIAIIAGAILNLVILLVGDLLYETNISLISAVIGSVVAVAVAKLLEFFRFCVDYSRTEKVQFEDDEYYYYVKAIPKMSVAAQTKTVKKINTQRRPASAPSRNTQEIPAQGNRTRSVVTEHTSVNRGGNARGTAARNYRNDHVGSGRSVTINSSGMKEDNTDQYDDLD